jgi:hypothetical protein
MIVLILLIAFVSLDIGVAAKIEEHTKRVKQLVDLGRLADRERDAERVREKRRERKMKYEKNSKDADKDMGAGKVAVLGSTEGSADAHYGGNSGDEDDGDGDGEDEGSVDEYGNNKYIKGAYEAHGDDSDDLRDPRIVNEDSDDEVEEEEIRAPVRKQKANQKNSKRSRSEAEDRNEALSDDDHTGEDGDLKAQEERVLKLLRIA